MNSLLPLVSVIIPNYNHAVYLDERIQSVLAQTYPHFEIILLDDCSTDDSATVLNRYRAHNRVSHVVINEQNSGSPFKQWAKGVELASGEWVWLAESDDWCEPTLLQTLVEGLTPTTCIAFCQSIAVKDDEILYINTRKHFYKTYKGSVFVREDMLKITSISNASQAIFKKQVYNKIDKIFTTYKFSGDWLFWILLAQHGDVYVSGKCLNYFRKHPKDVTSPSLKNGVGYNEYITTVSILERASIISNEEKVELLISKLNELLWDNRVEKERVQEIGYLYYEKIGNELFSFRAYRILGKRSFLKVLAFKVFGNY